MSFMHRVFMITLIILLSTLQPLLAQDAERQITVPKAPPASPEQIEERIRQAFSDIPSINSSQIILMIDDDILYLAGRSNSFYSADVAEDVARQFANYDKVINLIRMRREIVPDDEWVIKNNLANGLYWSPYLSPEDIEVEVTAPATVVLSGQVNSKLARFFAEKEAIEAGAKRIINKIQVNDAEEKRSAG